MFDSCPELIQIEVTDEDIESVAKRLSGYAGPSGIDSIYMYHWLLRFGGTSAKLRKCIAKSIE